MVMAKSYDSNIDASGKNLFWKFTAWLNKQLNPEHAWTDYQSKEDSYVDSWLNKESGMHLSGAEKEANAFNAAEAQKQRDWEAEMQNTAYQRQVADMRSAGVNPALAMSNGQPSTPSGASASSVAPQGGASMSELMQFFLLPAQKRLLEAQAKDTDTGAEKKKVEIEETRQKIEQLKLINRYYPSVTEGQLDKLEAEIGIARIGVDTAQFERDIKESESVIKKAEADNASELYHWKVEFEKAHTQEAKDSAAASAARAAWDVFEREWTQSHNGARPSSSGVLAIAAAICDFLGISSDDSETSVVGSAIKDKVGEISGLVNDPKGTIEKHGKEYDDKFARWKEKGKRFVKQQYRKSRTKYGLE